MGIRSITIIIFVIASYIIFHRQRHLDSRLIHKAAKGVQLSLNQSVRPYYAVGPYKDVKLPKLGMLDYFSRKRINSFIINHYNHYRIQLSFVDLGYTSEVIFKVSSSSDSPLYAIHQKIGFTLSQNFLDGSMNFDFNKTKFKLQVRQYINEEEDTTVTTFNISSHRKQANVTANLTHMARNSECLTAIRTGDIISHKCYGGIAAGKVKLERRLKKPDNTIVSVSNFYNLGYNLTRCMFDGLRGSSMHWNWIWSQASGFSKPYYYANNHSIEMDKFIGLNIGSINREGEDFAFLSGSIVPLKGVKYIIDEQSDAGSNITFTSTHPRMEANFTIKQVQLLKKDTGIFYLDMVIFHGQWAGWIQDQKGEKISFYEIIGIVQTCDSLF